MKFFTIKKHLPHSAALLVLFWGLFVLRGSVFAHVKWFSDFNFLTPPLPLEAIVTPTYIGLVVLSTVVIAGMVLIDRRLDRLRWYGQINEWLTVREPLSITIMRIAMAAVLLISWASDAILTPELASNLWPLIWLQFVAAILLLFPQTTSIAGASLLLVYVGAVFEFGLFHMLDYLHYIGIGVFLLVSQLNEQRWRSVGLPALYATVGFSLIWLGYEKLFYPSWSLYLLEQNPALTMGFPPDFFLQGAAFVEISLGFLLLIGLLERPLAAIITLVFFTTTLIFGKLEVIGHTPLHAALIVFLFSGAGTVYKPPMAIHKQLTWRVAFAAVNFVLIVALFAVVYSWSAHWQYETALINAQNGTHGMKMVDLTDAETIPTFTAIEVTKESPTSYNLHVEIENWTFTPELAGQEPINNQGHAHVFVDGRKVGRMYSDWFHLDDLKPGEHRIVVTLNANDHSDFVVKGKVIGAETSIIVAGD